MKNFQSIFILAVVFSLFSCSNDNEASPKTQSPALEVKTISNLHAPVMGGGGQPVSGDFVKFSFATGQVVTAGDKWDIGFRSTAIIVNGGGASANQPARTGNAAAAIVTGAFADVKLAPADNLFVQDSPTSNAIPAVSGQGWYNYNQSLNLITPIAGRVLVFRTHDGKFAKVEILSFYQNAPANPTAADASRYYKFNYVYQADGSRNF